MQEKLIEILSRATAWMTAAQIADAGNWRSAANVGVALQQMEKSNGAVERRKSPTAKQSNGMPATEWKLTEKHFEEKTETKMGRKPKFPPMEQSDKTFEQRAVEIAVDRHNKAVALDDEVAELRKHLADLTAENAGYCSLIEEQRREIKTLSSELGHARIQIDALNEQLMQDEEAVDVKDAAKGYLVCAPKRKPAKLMKAESAVARAKSAAKATGRCEVFALVPVGIATRKQIQAVEFKERAA